MGNNICTDAARCTIDDLATQRAQCMSDLDAAKEQIRRCEEDASFAEYEHNIRVFAFHFGRRESSSSTPRYTPKGSSTPHGTTLNGANSNSNNTSLSATMSAGSRHNGRVRCMPVTLDGLFQNPFVPVPDQSHNRPTQPQTGGKFNLNLGALKGNQPPAAVTDDSSIDRTSSTSGRVPLLLDPSNCYIVLHLQRTEVTQFSPPKAYDYPVPSHDFVRFMHSCDGCFTPRGVSSMFGVDVTALKRSRAATHNTTSSSNSKSQYVYSFKIYVYNGTKAFPLVAAVTVTSAFSLEKLVVGQSDFLAYLFYNLGTTQAPAPLKRPVSLEEYTAHVTHSHHTMSLGDQTRYDMAQEQNVLRVFRDHALLRGYYNMMTPLPTGDGGLGSPTAALRATRRSGASQQGEGGPQSKLPKLVLRPGALVSKNTGQGSTTPATGASAAGTGHQPHTADVAYRGDNNSRSGATDDADAATAVPPKSAGRQRDEDDYMPPAVHRFKTAPQPTEETPRHTQGPAVPSGLGKKMTLALSDMVDKVNNDEFTEYEEDRQTRLKRLMPVCSEILPYLYVGGETASQDKKQLLELGISTIVNAGAVAIPNHFPNEFEYVTLYLCDSPDEDIEAVFPLVNRAVELTRENNGKVFIHCHQGVSRSTTLVIAYLMWKNGWSLDYALRYAKERRSIVSPNSGFLVKLMHWEKHLTSPPLRIVWAYMPFSGRYPLPFTFRTIHLNMCGGNSMIGSSPQGASASTSSASPPADGVAPTQFILDVRACYVSLVRDYNSSDLSTVTGLTPMATPGNTVVVPASTGVGAGGPEDTMSSISSSTAALSTATGTAAATYPRAAPVSDQNNTYRVSFFGGSQCSSDLTDDSLHTLEQILKYSFYTGSDVARSHNDRGDELVFTPINFEEVRNLSGEEKLSDGAVSVLFEDTINGGCGGVVALTAMLNAANANATGSSVPSTPHPTHNQGYVSVVIGRDGQNDHALANDVSTLYTEMLEARRICDEGAVRRKKRRLEALREIQQEEEEASNNNNSTNTKGVRGGGESSSVGGVTSTKPETTVGGGDGATGTVASENDIGVLSDEDDDNTDPIAVYAFPFSEDPPTPIDFIDIEDLTPGEAFAVVARGSKALGKPHSVYLWRGRECPYDWDEIHEAAKERLSQVKVSWRTAVGAVDWLEVEEGQEPDDLLSRIS